MIKSLLTGLILFVASTAGAATYHISTTGNDANNGLSVANAWATFAHADLQLSPGDTLLIEDGTYDQHIKTTHVGTEAGGYITYKAVNNYQAVIAPTVNNGHSTVEIMSCPGCGGGYAAPLQKYIKLEGLMIRAVGANNAININSVDDATEAEMTHHIIVRHCGFFGSSQEDNGSIMALGNGLKDSLIEDVFSYGKGRKAAEAFGCLRVTIRRAVFRYDYWEGDDYKPNDPRTTFSGYNTQDSIFENIIAIDHATNPPGYAGELASFAASGNETPAGVSGSSNNSYLGLIVINNHGNGVDTDGGSGDPNTGLVFKDILSWNCSEGGDAFNVQGNDDGSHYSFLTLGNSSGSGLRFDPNPHAPITNQNVQNVFSTGHGINAYLYTSSQVPVFINNTSTNLSDNDDNPEFDPQYAPDISQRFLDPVKVAGHERGATILNRYVDGVQTNTPLWPWPDEDIVKQHMCDPADLAIVHRSDPNDSLFVGVPGLCTSGKTLTQYIWEANGATCPADICNSVGPVRSNPLPTGVQPSGTTSVQMEITTDVAAACKYGTDGATGVDYATMANTMSGTGTSHTATITGLVNGSSYSRAVRCTDGSAANDTDLIISWSVASGGGVINTILSGTGGFISGGGHFININQ